ncbi:hypothetical protein QA542_00590 [Staphylococcus saprophyticus]|nr:hypothetical protein QA542_00590 [Staphylococcus saprophyticus]
MASRSYYVRYRGFKQKNKLERPWLTVVLDDFSRAIAGYRIEFGAPDTIRTALVLREAIWKKVIQIGQFVESPKILY